MIRQITPMLHVPDLAGALRFFTEVLEFNVLFRMTNYAYLEWEEAGLRVLEERGRRAVPHEDARMTVYLDVADVDALSMRLEPRLRGIAASERKGPVDQHWGQRELQVRMPDGHWLTFGQAVEH